LANLTLENASPPSKNFSTGLFLRYGFPLGAPPTTGDKLMSNQQLIWGNLTQWNASPLSKRFSTVLFLRYGFRLGVPPMPGDKFFVKKRLILVDLKVLNASQPFTVCMIVTS
jgi:hypothetical protein